MHDQRVDPVRRFELAVGVAFLLAIATPGAQAANSLGVYAGGAYGQGRVDASFPVGPFSAGHSAYKIMFGLRPTGMLGAELGYVDFGHPVRPNGAVIPELSLSDVAMRGEAAFGMLYLPVPVVDVYAKAGLARLHSTGGVGCCGNPVAFPLNRTNTTLAGGVGLQYKLGAFGLRGEYERFNAASGNPHLLSFGATWTF